MDELLPELPLIRQILLRPTWTGNAAGGNIQQASLLCAVTNLGKWSRLLGRCANTLHLLGCHRLPDRGQLEVDVDGRLPDQGDQRGAAIITVQPLSIHLHPDLDHSKHHDEDLHSDWRRDSIPERGHPLPPALPKQDAIKGPAPMTS